MIFELVETVDESERVGMYLQPDLAVPDIRERVFDLVRFSKTTGRPVVAALLWNDTRKEMRVEYGDTKVSLSPVPVAGTAYPDLMAWDQILVSMRDAVLLAIEEVTGRPAALDADSRYELPTDSMEIVDVVARLLSRHLGDDDNIPQAMEAIRPYLRK